VQSVVSIQHLFIIGRVVVTPLFVSGALCDSHLVLTCHSLVIGCSNLYV
jgi:hypothetical protein